MAQETPTCLAESKPMSCSYCSPCVLEPVLYNKRSHHNEKGTREDPACSNEDPVQPERTKLYSVLP